MNSPIHPQSTAACEESWDAVVIGAGPAGALAARLLAQRGLHTLLVERKPFPRDKVCGGCVNGRALTILRHAGLPHLCEEIGAPALNRFRIRLGGRFADLPLHTGYAVSRKTLDEFLVRHAVSAGATFLDDTRAALLPHDPAEEFRTVLLHDHADNVRQIAARVVLAADGLAHSSLADVPEFAPRVEPAARLGLGAALKNAAWSEPRGMLTMAIGRRGYIGITRIEGDRLNVAAAVEPALVRELGAAAAIRSILKESGAPALEFGDDVAWTGTPPLTREAPRVAARRLFLLGDAAGYVEPFTGEGIAWALTAGAAVAPLAEEAVRGWREPLVRAWETRYNTVVRREQWICRGVTALLRHPHLSSWVLSALAKWPGLAAPFVRHLSVTPQRLEIPV